MGGIGLLAEPGVAVAVYPLVPTRSFDDPLTYVVDAATAAAVQVGSIVEVPVGAATRAGIVAALDVEAPAGVELKAVARVVDLPPVPATLVALALYTAETYGCAATRALAMVVPPSLAAHARAATLPVRRTVQAVVAVDGAALPGSFGARLRDVASHLPRQWTPVVDVLASAGTTRATLQKLVDAGVARIEQRIADDLRAGEPGATPDGAAAAAGTGGSGGVERFELNADQRAAVETCLTATGSDPATVLAGITGSGKTEVYLELIERVLADGRDAIVLVPEIALTPQTARRFLARFPGQVEVLHSGLTRTRRQQAWLRMARGDARVVVGPRSAVFAPLRSVGLIVIDEEHDSSYKQDSEPRYDARRIAWRRATLDDARLVYGSATPRPESWHGIARRALLPRRAGGGRLAPVRLVDLRIHGERFPITTPVETAIDKALRRGNKVIVMHNRRGYANALHCRACGHTFRCSQCDVSLVVHGAGAASQRFACHHCGYRGAVPRQCPHCNAADVVRFGAGSERIEREIAERFAVEVFRLDADAARERGSVAEVLAGFAAAGPAVLVGTQMVAKGHDFPDVELAVVVDADTALAIPDFRAEERAFSLVAQLAGRAGRSASTAEHARVLVQSWDTDAEFLQLAKHHDVHTFLERELERRRQHAYPPFTRLVRVLVSARDEHIALRWAAAAGEGIARMQVGAVLGPAPLLRLSGRHRAQVIAKTGGGHAADIARAVRQFLRTTERARRREDVRMALDVDPQSLL